MGIKLLFNVTNVDNFAIIVLIHKFALVVWILMNWVMIVNVNAYKGLILKKMVHVRMNVFKDNTKTIYNENALIVWIYVKLVLILKHALHVMSNNIHILKTNVFVYSSNNFLTITQDLAKFVTLDISEILLLKHVNNVNLCAKLALILYLIVRIVFCPTYKTLIAAKPNVLIKNSIAIEFALIVLNFVKLVHLFHTV